MKKKVFDYINAHSHVSVHKIAQELQMEEIDVLGIVNELQHNSLIKMDTPVPLSATNDCSCYYTATGKKYEEKTTLNICGNE